MSILSLMISIILLNIYKQYTSIQWNRISIGCARICRIEILSINYKSSRFVLHRHIDKRNCNLMIKICQVIQSTNKSDFNKEKERKKERESNSKLN